MIFDEWSLAWTKAQVWMHEQVEKINATVSATKKNRIIDLALVDAVNLHKLHALGEAYDHVYSISEHSVELVRPNISIYKLPVSFYGAYFSKLNPKECSIEKQFNCFINRVDPIRQSWFYIFYLRKWLDKGFISFNLTPGGKPQYLPLATQHNIFDHNHDCCLKPFDHIKEEIKTIVPFKNFAEDIHLENIIMKSKFSIILETYFNRVDCKIVTEKTWRAIQLPRPWLLFAATGTVERLRQLGFDVFDDYVNHDYDTHDTSETCDMRQQSILAEAEKLMSLCVTPHILADWNRRANHNRKILQEWNSVWQAQCSLLINQVAEMAMR